MGTSTLLTTYKRWLSESEWLVRAFGEALDINHDDLDQIVRLPAEMCLIRLYDAWSRFCRELVIVSAACRPYTAGGTRLPKAPGISNTSDVIPALLSTYRRRIYEPKWGRASDCIDAASRLGIANTSTITGALGAVSSPERELRITRNFFAHRSEWAANEIRSLHWYISGMSFSIEDLPGQKVQGGITLFEHWVSNLRTIAEAAIQ